MGEDRGVSLEWPNSEAFFAPPGGVGWGGDGGGTGVDFPLCRGAGGQEEGLSNWRFSAVSGRFSYLNVSLLGF